MEISEFIRKYGKPYDPATDNYDVPPFQENIDNASKSSHIYHAQRYWTKQDPYTVKRFIEHYTQPGDIVLDAFAGTGMTGVAAMMSGRHAILFDISPACLHMARNFTTPIEPGELERAYHVLRSHVEEEIAPLYQTTCHKCHSQDARIISTVLSDVYQCPRCHSEVVYADEERWQQLKAGKEVGRLRCPGCQHTFSKASADFFRVTPIELRISCPHCRIIGTEATRALTQEDRQRYQEIEQMSIPYWYPKDVVFTGQEPKRNYKRGITHPYQMFSHRNLIALSIVWHYIQQVSDCALRDKLVFIFTGATFKASYMLAWGPRRVDGEFKEGLAGPEGIRAGTLYIPSLISEKDVLFNLDQKVKLVMKGMSAIHSDTRGKTSTVVLEKRSAMDLVVVPDRSVDYLFYDPPYGSNIEYSALNLMWEAWLGETTDTREEIIENQYQGKDRTRYGEMMTQALQEAFRVLKPGRWLSVVYSYSDPSMYRLVQKMAHDAGFVDEGDVIHIGSTRRTKSQMDSDKTQQRYLVIGFKKPKNGERKYLPNAEDIEYNVIVAIQEFLQGCGGQTRDAIYDQVIKRLFTSVQIEHFDLDEILKNFFRKVGDKWYAPGTLIARKILTTKTGQLPLGFDAVEEPETETVLRLQEFLAKQGTVPLSELREYYLREVPLGWQEVVDFERAIEGFTVKEGKVRLPTPEEQKKKQDVTTRFRIREIKRFLEGTLPRQPDDAELCRWIELCYQHELYREGAQLFSKVDAAFLTAEEYQRAKKLAQACQLYIE